MKPRYLAGSSTDDNMALKQLKYRQKLRQIISKNLKNLLKSEKGAAAKAAQACGIPEDTLWKWTDEKEHVSLDIAFLLQLVDHFNVTLEWLITDFELQDWNVIDREPDKP